MRTLKFIPSAIGCYQTVLITLMFGETFSQNDLYPVEPKGQPWTPPTNEDDYRKPSKGDKYVGLLIAGLSEFNWIVDVRLRGESAGFWSIGNLVSYHHVLTPCRFARSVIQKKNPAFTYRQLEYYDWGVYGTGILDIEVRYCEHYLYQDSELGNDILDWGHSGKRAVRAIAIHPKCSSTSLLHDVAVMRMRIGISALVPMIGYMPVNIDYTLETIKDTGADYLRETTLCYVASFGRGYANLPKADNAVDSTKVKYRVYFEKWKVCNDVFPYICSGHEVTQCKTAYELLQSPPLQDLSILCFSTRAKVGTVCDHDRGAPVVCNGDVVGIVIRGANETRCNNVYHIPFIVLKIDNFKSFLEQTVDWLDAPLSKYKAATDTATIEPLRGRTALLAKNMSWVMLSIAIFSVTFI